LAREGSPEAEASFREAIALARRQGAKMYELRATTSLARWLTKGGRVAEARRMLARLYGLVHRGLRHAGPGRGEGAAGGARLSQEDSTSPVTVLADRVQDLTPGPDYVGFSAKSTSGRATTPPHAAVGQPCGGGPVVHCLPGGHGRRRAGFQRLHVL